MKLKGKIIAAALSAIVAASSFGTAITASAEQTYTIGGRWSGNPFASGSYLVDTDGNHVNSSAAVPGKTYVNVITVRDDITDVCLKVWIMGDESSAIYPNCGGTIRYTFVMPARNITIEEIYGPAGSLTPPTPTPTPTPDPTPTWKKGDADCNGTVNAADATAVLKHIVGIKMLSDQGFKNADMDDNGQITTADATAILKMIISKP